MAQEYNWAKNYAFKAAHIHRPGSVDELRRLVARSPKIHALGARHSFNGVADSSGALIDLGGLDPGILIDEPGRTASVGAATTYGALAAHLESNGWALHNMASLPHISLAGAIATGTHGSGDKSGSLATAVAARELVTATGDLIRIRRGEAGFAGMVVGLGAFGVVTRVTLDIEPSFKLRQDAFAGLPWTTVLADFDRIMSAACSVSLITLWSNEAVDRLWLKAYLDDAGAAAAAVARWGVVPAPYPNITASSGPDARLTEFGVPGPWSERLPHFQFQGTPGLLDQIQSEYMLPRRMATRALAELRAIAQEIDRYLIVTEIRTVRRDDLWLSPCYGDDSVAIHFTWRSEPGPVHAITSKIEEMLLPLGARPHWGKVIHARADRIARLYPRLSDFRDLARTYDPNGTFRNEFLETHVFG